MEGEDLAQLVDQARKGDKAAMQTLKGVSDPRLDLWLEEIGELGLQAESALLDHVCGPDLFRKEALKRKLAVIRAEQAGPSASPLQRLAAERVAACWLQVHAAERLYAHSLNKPKLNDYFQDQLDRSHRRFESMLRTSAHIQRLTGVVVQLNVGAQQVNIANP